MCIRDSHYSTSKFILFTFFNFLPLSSKMISAESATSLLCVTTIIPVSYTHLDVYKRQSFRNKAGKEHRGYAANLEESVGTNGSVVDVYKRQP